MRIFIYALIVLLVLRLIGSPAFSAECLQNVKKVENGTTVTCDGWLVSEPQMQEFTKDYDELELQRKLNLQQEQLRKFDLQEIEYYKVQSKSNQKALEKSESQKFWSTAGGFILGVVLTGIAAKAAIESTR